MPVSALAQPADAIAVLLERPAIFYESSRTDSTTH